jgi:hypothetical protein
MSPTQSQFFLRLKGLRPLHKAWVDEIAELLGTGNDSATRRIRGEKPIDLRELQQLAAHCKGALDHLLPPWQTS